MKRVALISIFLLLVGFISTSFAVEVTLFGPEQFIKVEEEPVLTEGEVEPEEDVPTIYSDTFPGVVGGATLKITNGNNDKHRITSAEIWINGSIVVGPSSFKQEVAYFAVDISLLEQNDITVKLDSKPGCCAVLVVYDK